MRNFIILFNSKEGSTAIVSILNNFDNVAIIQNDKKLGFEPFDKDSAGNITNRNLKRILEMIFDDKNHDFSSINKIYQKSANSQIQAFNKKNIIGFKMRFQTQDLNLPGWLGNSKLLKQKFIDYKNNQYRKMMMDIFIRFNVTVFLMVRQNIFEWAFSQYHGDGSGNRGHLQFKLALGEIGEKDIKPIIIEENRFIKVLNMTKNKFEQKRKLYVELVNRNIRVIPLIYEDFLNDQKKFFSDFFRNLDIPMNEKLLEESLEKGTILKKVHKEDLKSYIINHDEILAKYGRFYIPWIG